MRLCSKLAGTQNIDKIHANSAMFSRGMVPSTWSIRCRSMLRGVNLPLIWFERDAAIFQGLPEYLV
jgi:hypothetical protein